MERVWEELKKIEAQAEQMRNEAQGNAKKIIELAQKEAEELLAKSETYAKEESQQLYMKTIQEANHNRDELLKANQNVADKLRVRAEEHMRSAASEVVKALIEET
jgi:vacuolar-type H+-ATPase subunit H